MDLLVISQQELGDPGSRNTQSAGSFQREKSHTPEPSPAPNGIARRQMYRTSSIKLGVLFAKDRLIAILKQVPISPMATIVGHGVTRQQPPHEPREPLNAAPQQNMKVIGHEGPRINTRLPLRGEPPHTGDERVTIVIILKYPSLLYPSDNHMMKCPGGDHPCLSRHEVSFSNGLIKNTPQ